MMVFYILINSAGYVVSSEIKTAIFRNHLSIAFILFIVNYINCVTYTCPANFFLELYSFTVLPSEFAICQNTKYLKKNKIVNGIR